MKKSLLFITSMIAINLYLNVKASECNLQSRDKDFSTQKALRSLHKSTIMNSPLRIPVSNDSPEFYSLTETIALEKLTQDINDQARIKNSRKATLRKINTKFTPKACITLQTIDYSQKYEHENIDSPQQINHNFSPTHR